MRIEWGWFCARIMDELRALPTNQRSMTLSLGDLLKRTKAVGQEPKRFRTRVYWAGALRGRGAWGAARQAGLCVSLNADLPSGEIKSVTFRLEEQAREAQY